MQKFTAMMLLLLAGQAQAEWYETTGQAAIRNGDQASARARATEDAVKRALLFAGVSVRSVQQVTDGLLTQDSMQLKSHGEVQQVHLVSERATNGTFEVTIRADIVPGEAACPNVAYKKKLLIAPFKLKVPEQAVIGDLFELGKVSSELFNDKLTELSQSSWTHAIPAPLDVSRLSYNERHAIARQYGARYVLNATLNDVSLGESDGTNWQFWTDKDRERFYHLQLSVFDLTEARMVLQQKYQTSAMWRVRKTTALDPQYHRFWQSSYGQAAERVLDAAVLDVEEAIRCEPVVAELLQVRENQVLLNLGSLHGVQVGDTFTIVHKRELIDNFRQTQPLLTVTHMTVQVTQLSNEAAWAQSVDGQLLANVQSGDLAQAAKTVVKDEWVEQE
jgi:hypothetical protein